MPAMKGEPGYEITAAKDAMARNRKPDVMIVAVVAVFIVGFFTIVQAAIKDPQYVSPGELPERVKALEQKVEKLESRTRWLWETTGRR
jgi:hypothetical protein